MSFIYNYCFVGIYLLKCTMFTFNNIAFFNEALDSTMLGSIFNFKPR